MENTIKVYIESLIERSNQTLIAEMKKFGKELDKCKDVLIYNNGKMSFSIGTEVRYAIDSKQDVSESLVLNIHGINPYNNNQKGLTIGNTYYGEINTFLSTKL